MPARYLAALLFFWTLSACGQNIKLLVQSSPLAGFQYYQGEDLWREMREGDRLTLVREPENSFDARAVRVEWHGKKLGYLPRIENGAVAEAMDRGEQVEGRIARLFKHRNPWQRIRVEVFVVL